MSGQRRDEVVQTLIQALQLRKERLTSSLLLRCAHNESEVSLISSTLSSRVFTLLASRAFHATLVWLSFNKHWFPGDTYPDPATATGVAPLVFARNTTRYA